MEHASTGETWHLPRRLRVTAYTTAVACEFIALFLLSRQTWAGAPTFLDLAMALLVVGWLAAGIAILGEGPTWTGIKDRAIRVCKTVNRRRPEAITVVLILVAAAAIRIAPLGEIPPAGVPWYEEDQTGEIANGILSGGDRPLEYPLVNYGAALSFSLFGTSTSSLKIPCIIIGWLSVVLLFATARHLFQPPIALFVTAMFAFSRWHILVNHVADENGPPLLLLMAILYLLVTSGNHFTVARFFLLGTLLGITMYVYAGYRFLFLAVPLFFVCRWLWRFLRHRGVVHPNPTERLRPLAGLLLGFSIAAVPLGFAAITGDPRANLLIDLKRNHNFALPIPGTVEWEHTRAAAEIVFRTIFYDQSDEWISAGGRPAVEPITAVLALLGLGWAIVTFWRPARAFLAFWTPAVAAMGTIVLGHIYLHRLCPIIPMLYILMGFPLDDLWRFLGRWRTKWPKRILGLVLIAALAIEATGNIDTLFRQFPNDRKVLNFFEDRSLDQPKHATEMADGSDIYLWSDLQDPISFYRTSDLSWLTGILRGRPMASLFDVLPLRSHTPPEGIVLSLRLKDSPITPSQADVMAAFYYPDLAETADHTASASGRITSQYYRLPGSLVTSRRGLHGRYSDDDTTTPGPVLSRVDRLDGSSIRLETELATRTLNVAWSGLAWLDANGEYAFRFEGHGKAILHIDGEHVLRGSGESAPTGAMVLDRGWHTVQLSVDGFNAQPSPRLLVGPTDDDLAPFPNEDLHAVEEFSGLVRTWFMVREGEESVYQRRIEPTISRQIVIHMMNRVRDEFPGAELVRERWDGWFEVDTPSTVRFNLRSRQGGAHLEIDGETILEIPSGMDLNNDRRNARMRLEAGTHRLSLIFDYDQRNEYSGGVDLSWSAGSQGMSMLPPGRLSPIPPAAEDR